MIPVNTYLTPSKLRDGITSRGAMREVQFRGRSGLQVKSVASRICLPAHTVHREHGAITLWAMALEDLSSVASIPHILAHEADYITFPLLSDNEDLRNWPEASFAWIWAAHWYPQLWAKFYKGGIYPDAFQPPRALALAGHFNFHALRWYQLGLTWDKPADQYRVYANGVLVATSNQFAKSLESHPCGETLYLGDPAIAFGEIKFYDTCPGAAEMAGIYASEAIEPDDTLDAELKKTFAGAEPEAFEWKPDASWIPRVDLPLNEPGTLDKFYVQGYSEAPSVTNEGILVETKLEVPEPGEEDDHQVYLWTREAFEGDFAVEFEFKPTLPNGLSLLMLQANGMHREDFMADYPLRTTGSMAMVYGENVRNYHWEFFRGMDDTRNDVASNALIKQPWNQPLAYHCAETPLELNRWHRLQFVQERNRLRGAINGTVVFDVTDGPGAFTGSHYNCGHFAIRCMTKTRNFYRNLRIWTKPLHPDLKVRDLD